MAFFDIFALTLLILFGFLGYKKGIVEEIFKLGSLFLAILISIKHFNFGYAFLLGFGISSEGILIIGGFLLVFLLVIFGFRLLEMILVSAFESFHLGWLNKSAGLIFGIVKGGVLIIFFIWIISLVPEFNLEQKVSNGSESYIYFDQIEKYAEKSFDIKPKTDLLRKNFKKIFNID